MSCGGRIIIAPIVVTVLLFVVTVLLFVVTVLLVVVTVLLVVVARQSALGEVAGVGDRVAVSMEDT